MSADPQVNPAPQVARQTRAPEPISPDSTASLSATGNEAALRWPCSTPAMRTFDESSDNCFAASSATSGRMWLSTKQSTSSTDAAASSEPGTVAPPAEDDPPLTESTRDIFGP